MSIIDFLTNRSVRVSELQHAVDSYKFRLRCADEGASELTLQNQRLRAERNAARRALAEAQDTIRLLGRRNDAITRGSIFTAEARTAAVRERNLLAAELERERCKLAMLAGLLSATMDKLERQADQIALLLAGPAGDGAEGGGRRTEVRGQKSEVGSRRSEGVGATINGHLSPEGLPL